MIAETLGHITYVIIVYYILVLVACSFHHSIIEPSTTLLYNCFPAISFKRK